MTYTKSLQEPSAETAIPLNVTSKHSSVVAVLALFRLMTQVILRLVNRLPVEVVVNMLRTTVIRVLTIELVLVVKKAPIEETPSGRHCEQLVMQGLKVTR